MDSIENRYNKFKTITSITLVLGLLIAFGTLLSRESRYLEIQMIKLMKRFKK